MKYYIPMIATMLMLCASVAAQQTDDYDRFMEDAGESSVLFRGHRAMQYRFHANGHQYWDTTDFLRGDIVYNGKQYSNILLNIDALTQELLAMPGEGHLTSIVLDREHIGTFSIGDSHFTKSETVNEKLPAGFTQIVRDGDIPIYRHVDKRIKTSTNGSNPSDLGYEVAYYNFNYIDYFEIREAWFTVKKGKIRRIRRNKALKMLAHETT